MSAVQLTITARDAAHARKILEAVERLDDTPDILVQPDGSGAPTGHTYRELNDARRSGLLDASLTPKGLVFTAEALDQYRTAKAERRRGKRTAAPVTDITEARIKALETAGVKVR